MLRCRAYNVDCTVSLLLLIIFTRNEENSREPLDLRTLPLGIAWRLERMRTTCLRGIVSCG